MAMNPNAAMANMNPMGGPVGSAPMPMMNNGNVNPQAAAAAAAAARQQQLNDNQRSVLNTYIYEYFLRYGMFDCARALLSSHQQVNVKDGKTGNAVNGTGDDSMDTDSKDDIDSKTPDDLPAPKLPMPASDTSFLYEWFCLFWDIYNAQRVKGNSNGTINQYVMHTQEMLRMRPDMQQAYQAQMARNMQGGMAGMKQGNLARTAMANNQNPQMMLAKQNPMQRDPSHMNTNQDRPSSPAAGGDNAPSPSAKRQRTDGGPGMNPQQMMNVTGAQAAHQLLTASGINPNSLTPQQLSALANTPPHAQQKSIATYMANMQSHHGKQLGTQPGMPNVPNPPNQGSPMVPHAPDGTTLNNFYNAPEIGGNMRAGPPGAAAGQGTGSNHALQDYQMQLMLLEQQNKKRLMMARQEQDNMGGPMPREGPPGPGPNGQFTDASPQAMRSGASPNPGDQMKRGTPQMNNSGIPSPVPEGGQSRDSPNPMNFMNNQVDPSMAPHFFKGIDPNMAGAQGQMNGMRPPSSHPGQPFTPQQIMAARAQGQGNPQQWQPGPNGQMVGQGMPQNPQAQGTPQQRAMPPPSAPAGAGANANNRTTASPQQSAAAPPTPNQGTKAAPKKKETKAAKDKRAAAQKSKAAAANAAGATPAADGAGDGDSAAPATPMTPSFNKAASNAQGNAAPATTAPAASAPAVAAPAQSQGDLGQNGLGTDNYGMVDFPGMEFANPLNTGDVLNDFDFDSFLHDNDGNTEAFDFNGTFSGMEGNEIGAE
ncbi:cAMP-dependent protein kinase pathway protein (Som1) [Cordyceps javanica]|uniref:cAMP-dependent protein kinase pathway protein (Som1) n=1 Tax=Cordyceps javanica TaxID=43265 RepID=A0A545WBG7_9HYPO|nr:cAMP-dependent protein kinase pathway protein (Som1) [Cordyceps javanica]TQW11324.1 cAMP-dependent protein kinase pathway protein (Som1) [Cordyceps javanica]